MGASIAILSVEGKEVQSVTQFVNTNIG
jgi:hypothetical protein